MRVKIDFSLSKRFGIVEQTIFRLILAGINDVQTIKILLSLYSDDVLANAIMKLVNYQILKANIEMRTLTISEPLMAMMENCLRYSLYLYLEIENNNSESFYITEEGVKQQILNILLPGIKTGFLLKSLDFVISSRGDQNEE